MLDDGTPSGLVRFDPLADGTWEVRIELAPVAHGRGIAIAALEAAGEQLRAAVGDVDVVAHVLAEHGASQQVFVGAGYVEASRAAGVVSLTSRGRIVPAERASILVTVAQLAAGAVVLPFVTRRLGAGSLGIVVTATVVAQASATIGAAGLPAVIARLARRGPGSRRRARFLVAVTGVVALAVALVAHATGPLWTRWFPDLRYGPAMMLAVGAAITSAFVAAAVGLLRAEERRRASFALLTSYALVAHVVGALALARGGGPVEYLGGWAIGGAVVAVVAFALVRPARPDVAPRSIFAGAGPHAGRALVHSAAVCVLLVGDRVLIERYLGLEALGRYHVAVTVGSLGVAIAVARTRDPRAWAHAVAVFAIGAPIALLATAPEVYERLALVPIVAIAALSAMAAAAYLTSPHAAPLPAVVAAALVVVIDVIVVQRWGLVGASVVALAAFGVLALMSRSDHDVGAWGWAVVAALAGALLPTRDLWFVARGAAAALLALTFAVRLRTAPRRA